MISHEKVLTKKSIGVLGGLGPESTISFYRALTQKYYQQYHDYAYPEVLIHSFDFQAFIDARYRNAKEVIAAVKKLSASGAAFVVAPCNSIHLVFKEVCETNHLPIPWLSIMASTIRAIRQYSCTKVGLLGTIFTMSQPFFHEALRQDGIETMIPSPADQDRLNRIIYDDLVRGIVTPESKKFVVECIDRLAQGGVGGIILGCTELPLLVGQTDTALPVFDTTDLQAQHALEISLGLEPLPQL